MAFFPRSRSRQESVQLFERNRNTLDTTGHSKRRLARQFFERNRNTLDTTGFGFYALEEKTNHAVIGAILLLQTGLEPYIAKNTVEIGWR